MEETHSLIKKYYQVNGVLLHVMESGPDDGPVLLLLHGFPEFWYGWRKQIPYFAEQGYRVVVPDQRGYNLSTKPKGIHSYVISELMQDIVELIAVMGAEKVYLVGHDWGAIVAWNLAMHHPELFHRIVIINVPHPAVMWRTLRKRLDQLRRSWYVFFIQIPFLPQWLASIGSYWPIRRMLKQTSLPGTFKDEDLQKYQVAWSQPGSFNAMLNWYRAVRYRGFTKKTGNGSGPRSQSSLIATPLLIIWGVHDVALRAEMASESVNMCQNGRLVRMEDATHWVHLEKSEQVNQIIHGFLREE